MMLLYILKRLLYFIPTLLVISLLTFFLSRVAPGDPVMLYYRNAGGDFLDVEQGSGSRVYRETRVLLGLDRPVFYFSLLPAAYPDTLYRIQRLDQRLAAKKLIAQSGNWPAIQRFYDQLEICRLRLTVVPDTVEADLQTVLTKNRKQLLTESDTAAIAAALNKDLERLAQHPNLANYLAKDWQELKKRFALIGETAQPSRLYTPDFKWYGLYNQYHHWLLGFFTGNMGVSYYDGRPVSDKIADALKWTVFINAIAIVIAYLTSVFLGVHTAVRKGKTFDRVTTFLLFVLYSLPSFWIASLLLVFFTSPEYGMNFFSVTGINNSSADVGFFTRIGQSARQLVLPVFCLTYGAIAIITLQMRGGMLEVLQQDYIRTARAKGLPRRQVVWKHAFRNALFPIITILGALLPAVITGSVIIESIFNIPGMGKLVIDSIGLSDWPVVYGIVILGAVLSMLGILIADILYALVDPRVSFTGSKTSTR